MRWLAALLLFAGCGAEPPPKCTSTQLDDACLPQYQPTFANVYANTLTEDCGSTKGACHKNGGEAGLSFADEDTAYNNLLNRHYVVPGGVACSEFIVRTADTGKDYSMPKDSAIGDSEKCALQQWVRNGAQR
ncbi:hypothetical protein BH11MYX2_BH11MYX2_06060 [soil metagenome]